MYQQATYIARLIGTVEVRKEITRIFRHAED